LEKSDDVAVRVLLRCDQLSTADIADGLSCLSASVEDGLDALVDVIDLPVADK
jgi:hypothetical protein